MHLPLTDALSLCCYRSLQTRMTPHFRPLKQRRGRRQSRIADACVEADPVGPRRASARVPVAHMNSPKRWIVAGNEPVRGKHGLQLVTLAALLPLTADPDIKNHRVVKGNGRASLGRDCEQSHPSRHSGGDQELRHMSHAFERQTPKSRKRHDKPIPYNQVNLLVLTSKRLKITLRRMTRVRFTTPPS